MPAASEGERPSVVGRGPPPDGGLLARLLGYSSAGGVPLQQLKSPGLRGQQTWRSSTEDVATLQEAQRVIRALRAKLTELEAGAGDPLQSVVGSLPNMPPPTQHRALGPRPPGALAEPAGEHHPGGATDCHCGVRLSLGCLTSYAHI